MKNKKYFKNKYKEEVEAAPNLEEEAIDKAWRCDKTEPHVNQGL